MEEKEIAQANVIKKLINKVDFFMIGSHLLQTFNLS